MNGLNLPIYAWVLIGVLLFTQALWIFIDASKRGENKWIWGIFGLLNVPSSLIVYLLITRVFLKGKECKSCRKKVKESYRYCPFCGNKQEINK